MSINEIFNVCKNRNKSLPVFEKSEFAYFIKMKLGKFFNEENDSIVDLEDKITPGFPGGKH